MAITRAQQYRQMLEDGGMLVKPGNGKRPGYRSAKAQEVQGRTKASTTKPGTSGGSTAKDDDVAPGYNPKTGRFERPDPSGPPGTMIPEKARTPQEVKQDLRRAINRGAFRKEGIFDAVFPTATNFLDTISRSKLARINNAIQRQNYINSLDLDDPEEKAEYDRIMNELGGLGINIIAGPETLTDTRLKQPMSLGAPTTIFKPTMSFDDDVSSLGDPDVKDILGEGFQDYLKRFDSPDRDDRGPSDPCLGPNPPPYCFIGKKADETIKAQRNLAGLTARIGGSLFAFDEDPITAADGGRIGYDDGGMLVQPGFGGTRQGYRSAKAQESKQKSAQEYKASTTQQQRDDDRRDFQEQRRQAVQRLEEVKPTSRRGKGIENAVRTASELNYLRNLYKLDPVGLGLSFIGNKISDFLFPPLGAAEPSEDELNILRATGQLENQKQKILDATGIGSGAVGVGPVPDLTDPKVAGSIAEAGGLTTGLKKVGGKEIFGTTIGGEQIRVPTDLSQQAIEEIQKDKRQLGLTRDQVIDKALDFDYPTSITEEGAGTIYDMVQADQLPRTLAAEGGIMDLGRQELFLGGIAKGLKKAARGVSRTLKKVAKSPIGKAAILGAIGFGIPGTSFGGIFGKGALSKLIGQKAMTQAPFAPGTGILGFIQKNPLLAIAGTSALAGALTPKEEDDQDEFLRQYYSMRLDPSQSVRGMGSQFDFYNTQFVADGGRIGYQEGSKEPVAKKTMPLLDMDGQEMDLRDNGGFVPIGRMEKADDVPARLSKNEFVFTADAVRNAGDGDVDKGAEVMYNMMKNLERGGNVSDESQGLEGAREMFQTSKRLEEVL